MKLQNRKERKEECERRGGKYYKIKKEKSKWSKKRKWKV